MPTLTVAPERDSATRELARYFEGGGISPDGKQAVTACAQLAQRMINTLPDGPELHDALRHLLSCMHSFVRGCEGVSSRAREVRGGR